MNGRTGQESKREEEVVCMEGWECLDIDVERESNVSWSHTVDKS